jgi:hypothetical protein
MQTMNEPGIVRRRIEDIVREAVYAERLRCANIALMFPLEGFCYDTANHGEILRLRDTISEAILKTSPGERLR